MAINHLQTTAEDWQVSVAQVVAATEAEGPGRRFAVWFQGCPLRCPGCCNPEFLPFSGGLPFTVNQLLGQIELARNEHQVEGVSLIGGEPFAHLPAAGKLAAGVQALGLSVMVYSGYTLAEIHAWQQPAAAELLAHTDLLVDGPYLRDQPETTRRWIGSSNQQLHFLTPFYQPDDPRFHTPNTLEIRLENGHITINGFPAPAAVGLWKRLDKHQQPKAKTDNVG